MYIFDDRGGLTRQTVRRADPLLVLLPLLIVLSTLLLVLLTFLVSIFIVRRNRHIVLRDTDGPIDLSREDLIQGDGGFEGIESRWLESVSQVEQDTYRRAQGEVPDRRFARPPLTLSSS